jgi:hypothetical protein
MSERAAGRKSTMRGSLALLAGVASVCCMAAGAQAQALDSYLAEGYRIQRTATVIGAFHGCAKDDVIHLSDGTQFVCKTNRLAGGFRPNALFLTNDAGNAALLIGGRPYVGSISQLGHQIGGAPISVGVDDMDAGVTLPVIASPARPQQAIAPIESVQDQFDETHPRLNDAQAYPVLVTGALEQEELLHEQERHPIRRPADTSRPRSPSD